MQKPSLCEVSCLDDRAIVLPRGDIDLSTAPAMLRDARAALALTVERIVVDLRHVTFMDSSGIHALNAARIEAAEHGIGFTLASVPPQPRTVLEITGLAEVFGLAPRPGSVLREPLSPEP
jgi:anti-sigma B factor antagonist